MPYFTTKVLCKLSIPINIITESHPECINDETLRDIIVDYLMDDIEKNAYRGAVSLWLDGFDTQGTTESE
jgi:hypothetical protein